MGKEVQQQVALNLLSEGTQITGDLHASNDIRVDGTIKGKINTTGRLIIGQTARVEGEVTSPSVDILGTMEGSIVSDGSVSLRAKSVFTGTIKAAYIAIESGAVFNGECHIQRDVKQK
ncbi:MULTISPECIES: bactofilin family protein [Butyricimonas]|uniref:Polymer-forming cytoskeletal protein n=1 Tax=Butyricimonas hominis TaxID=2763032 RepID=A0ABR7CX57_9BACT|nr:MULTISPECIES: polymer-forming cytoskeletal protein [Butyricimonas]MBC5619900.1 polymer-forming cytoskeletal protein [Butyricimonas hominis]MCB6973481.1 polymer-forming cytoskeletal protein [Butyricimonas synergistica]MCG4520415.1 polymer-forming cytoskeletal protein [Butyricimonas sp. DFI.6.44]